jgi:hypothetical protein
MGVWCTFIWIGYIIYGVLMHTTYLFTFYGSFYKIPLEPETNTCVNTSALLIAD